MGRRSVIILSATLILALSVILYFTGKSGISISKDPYCAVTGKACFVIETVDLLSFLNSLTAGNGLFGELGKINDLTVFNGKLKYITDNLNKDGLRNLTSGGHAVVSFYHTGNGKLSTLLSMPVESDVKQRHVRQALSAAGINGMLEMKQGKIKVLGIPYSRKSDTLFFSTSSGLLLVCNSSALLTESLMVIESGDNILGVTDFSKVLLASGNNEDKIFIIFENLPGVLKPLFSPESRQSVNSFASLASAGGGDLYVNDDGLVLNGFTESGDTSDVLYKFKLVRSSEFETYRILPASTALFETIIRDVKKQVRRSDTSGVGFLAAEIEGFIDDEITRAYIDIRENITEDNNLIIYEMNNPIQAEQSVQSFAGSELIRWFQPDDQVSIPVYHLPANGLGRALIPGFSGTRSDSLAAFYDSYMITGGSYTTITKLLYDNLLNNTLANDLVYRDFESSMPSRCSYCFYCVPSKTISYFNGILNDSIIASLKENKGSLNKVTAAGYQLASSNGMVYNSFSVRFKDVVKEESKSEWETLLDTTAGIKPFFFINHLTGAREIFVQDLKNNIYLINAAGRVLWKAPLSEKIQGAIYMIDYYRNGKYQLLFNGRKYLHLIDRNGNYVERYPVKLRSEASNSLSLFDYDNNRNYRILLAGEDRLIYAYDKSGNVVKGWKPFRTSGIVRNQLNYFKVSGKDFIAVSDEFSLYLLDRNGNKRVTFRDPVNRAERSAIKLSSGSEPYLICSSAEGAIQYIYFDGSIKKFDVGKFSPSHSMDIFDIDSDGFDEFVFVDRGKLYLYDHNRIELFSKDLGTGNLEGPITFSFTQDDKKIGIIDKEKNLVYLLDKSGEIIEGFPLKGASMFSIGRLSDKNAWHLIVGGPDKFLYNYLIGSGT